LVEYNACDLDRELQSIFASATGVADAE
jgi:hypothetical protein